MRKLTNRSVPDLLLGLILILLPISIQATNLTIILLFVWGIIYQIRNGEKQSNAKLQRLLVQTLPFIFITCTLSYSLDTREGLKGIEKYLPLIAFPLIFCFIQFSKPKIFFLRLFGMIVVAMVIICLLNAFYTFLFIPPESMRQVGDNYSKILTPWNAFSSTSLMLPFNVNPIYMALYLSLAIFFFALDSSIKISWRLFLIALLFVFHLLTASRIGIVSLALTALVFVLVSAGKFKKYAFPLFGVVIFVSVSAVMLIAFNPILKQRLMGDFRKYEIPSHVSGWNGLNIRHAIWKCSLELVKNAPFLGYGVGTQYQVREACYEQYTFQGPFGSHLNCHNQYLEYALIGGIILLILFLLQLYAGYSIAWRRKSRLYLLFLTLFCLTCLGESMLETHKGIVFFALFNSLFIFSDDDSPEKEPGTPP